MKYENIPTEDRPSPADTTTWGRTSSIRGRFLLAALGLVLGCSVVNFVVLGFFHDAVDRSGRRHLGEVTSLETAIEILNLTTRIDELARVITTDESEGGVISAYREIRQAVLVAERNLLGGPDGIVDISMAPALATIAQVRQAATLVFSARIAALRNETPQGRAVTVEHRAMLQAAIGRLVHHARGEADEALRRTARTADAIIVTSAQAMVVACISIVALLPPMFFGYRRLVVRGLMARLEVIRDAMLADLSRAAPRPVPVGGQDEIGAMARALDVLLGRAHDLHRAQESLAVERRRLNEVIENVDVAILGVDTDGRIERGNHVATEMFAAGHLPGLYLVDLIACLPPPGRDGRQAGDAIGLRGDRSSFPVHVAMTPLDEDPLRLRVVIVHDLTERRRVESALRREALVDDLTGQLNRRGFFERAEQECLRAERHALALTVLMIDIDHFKRINDAHGHAAGDAVLVAIAAELRRQCRETDIVGRLGGEEFVVLLPETDASGAGIFAERLRRAVAALPRLPSGLTSTISIGLAGRRPGESVADLMIRADAGLYNAKRSGRNQVAVA